MLIPGDIRLQPLANLLFQWPWGWVGLLVIFPAQPSKDWHGSSKRPHTTNCSSSGKRRFGAPRNVTTCFVPCSCGYDFTMMWSQGHHLGPLGCMVPMFLTAWLLGLPKRSGPKSSLWKRDWSEKSHWIWYTLLIMGILPMQKTSKYTNDIKWYIFEMLPLPVTVTFFHFVLGDLYYCNLYFPLFFFGGASRTRCIYIYIYIFIYYIL